MRDVRYISDWMEFIGRQTEEFKELVSGVAMVERCKIEVSDKLPRAWLHLLMALAFTKDMAPPWSTHMRVCLELMNDGMKETIQKLSNYQLLDYVAFTPFDVASLMTFQLPQDLTGSCPDICETYVDYMGSLGLLFRESLALIEERIEVFRNINGRATYLENWNLRSIDANKDRQETAIYAFTIVTVIFLRLSTVASILGMNTNDVRNMELTQWLFWVIAIPLTLIIIGLVLIWSDEWHNFQSTFSNLWGRKTKRRHVRLPEDYARVEPMTGLSVVPKARASRIYRGILPHHQDQFQD
ncbi:hypothetical protein DID88_007546 [Monilinia fructigena]|uniref:Uncharacterized protein n=1 Tax=Monilinia fructigena TaxID=38457 RepID=A0A395J524_9HELO|nr:hypothetical protein DID88_007546 [Monilinia fructigena]